MRKIIAQLRAMTPVRANDIVLRELSKAARPFAPRVRAAIMNTPSAGTTPWPPQVPGLRLRIARCVQAWAKIEAGLITVGVEVNAAKMPSGQKSLPLMLEGRKAWRHPVFAQGGDRGEWTWVLQASHPYFDEGMLGFGPATRKAIDRAIDNIISQIDG